MNWLEHSSDFFLKRGKRSAISLIKEFLEVLQTDLDQISRSNKKKPTLAALHYSRLLPQRDTTSSPLP
jgi:hypothetical protein